LLLTIDLKIVLKIVLKIDFITFLITLPAFVLMTVLSTVLATVSAFVLMAVECCYNYSCSCFTAVLAMAIMTVLTTFHRTDFMTVSVAGTVGARKW